MQFFVKQTQFTRIRVDAFLYGRSVRCRVIIVDTNFVRSMKLTSLPFDLDLSAPLAELQKSGRVTLVNLANNAAKNFLIAQMLQRTPFQNVFWASTDERSDAIAATAKLFFDGTVIEVPAVLQPSQLYNILALARAEKPMLLLFEDLEKTCAQKFPKEEAILKEALIIRNGETVRIFEVFEHLERMGYEPALDRVLQPGEFVRKGENLFVFPVNGASCIRMELFGDQVERIASIDQEANNEISECDFVEVFPVKFGEACGSSLWELLPSDMPSVFLADDLDADEIPNTPFPTIKFTTFPGEDEVFFHLNFFSVLPFYTIPDFVVDVKERFHRGFSIAIATKKFEELENIFRENEMMFTEDLSDRTPSTIKVVRLDPEDFAPHSFQNNERKFVFLTDKEIFQFHRTSRQKKAISGMNTELMLSLKPGDYVVHADHGVAKFEGIVRRDLSEELGTREFLRLGYSGNDKLFIPVASAEKITKFLGDDVPKLTRLGASDWQQSQKKLRAEAEKIAKELLKLYASRELAKGKSFQADDEMMNEFNEGFPYELTPGQLNAWNDVRIDLETPRPMDRLVCGDVGFGKTEIAMRAAFKTFRSGMQAVILAPITILAEQHFQSFKKRVEGKNFGVEIALLSRFQSAAEQRDILKKIELGLIDIVIGTHRLLSEDIKFKNIGLIVVDEEQRFGVKQKEKLKRMRSGVDVLTMTATPIPRTLNMSLNKLKDISTITTPPPGRLPVVTEVRKYNLNLIRERILFETERGGQVYFLHNEVRSIDGLAKQLEALVPEVKFLVAHGQLKPEELEQKVRAFKNGEAQVLIASTIIENGIDLSNANTLIVSRAEKFGLSQLYQLRGRVGRGRTQAYAFFLYHGQKLALEAKKRLRAIVEANELGSGFQIAMRDLEIRGAGEVLGVNQAGAIKNVGVSHFMRMLNKTVDQMRRGEIAEEIEETENITVEIPLSAYIPGHFIPNTAEKIRVYQELASAETEVQLDEMRRDLRLDFGILPLEVENLCRVIRLKMSLRASNLLGIKINRASHKSYEIVLRMGKKFTPDQIFELVQKGKYQWTITATALKLKMDILPVNWYDELVGEIEFLLPKKK